MLYGVLIKKCVGVAKYGEEWRRGYTWVVEVRW
jgi:hypothetical protein